MGKTPEEKRAYKRQWRAEHPLTEEQKAKKRESSRQLREKNPNYQKEYDREYRNTLHGRASKLLGCYNFHDKEKGFPQGDLTVDDVEEIIQKPCAHCGVSGWDVIGLNRLDNSKPHTRDNVEPCCLSCNCRLNAYEIHKKRNNRKKTTSFMDGSSSEESNVKKLHGYLKYAFCVEKTKL